ncbi:hypothetical protein B4100_3431 [Heyndrickxia coagulans]|nr:hypothetical protein B4100_3431 [Heyndrickxia coagulans]
MVNKQKACQLKTPLSSRFVCPAHKKMRQTGTAVSFCLIFSHIFLSADF